MGGPIGPNLHKTEPPQNGVQLDQRDRQQTGGA